MIRQVICQYESVFCILSFVKFVVVMAYQTVEKRKFSVLPGKLDVNVLFVENNYNADFIQQNIHQTTEIVVVKSNRDGNGRNENMAIKIFMCELELLFSCSNNYFGFFAALVNLCFASLVSPMCVKNHVTFICNSELERNAKSQKILCFFNYAMMTKFFLFKPCVYVFSKDSSDPFTNTESTESLSCMVALASISREKMAVAALLKNH